MRNDVFYTWNSIPLNSEKSLSLKRLDLKSLDLEDAISVVYPQLSFCGIFQVLEQLPNNANISPSRVYENYGYALDSKLTQLLHILPSLPSAFLHWCTEHSLSPRDLFPLLSLPSSEAMQEELKKISALSLSRNLGAQILELAVECHLLSASEKGPLNATNGDEWLQQLKTQRYPQTLLSDSEKQKKNARTSVAQGLPTALATTGGSQWP
jgi:hypothetical protein